MYFTRALTESDFVCLPKEEGGASKRLTSHETSYANGAHQSRRRSC
jgi:hypothetical protein